MKREGISAFLGYNHNKVIAPGELYDCENITSRDFPLISPRGKRKTLKTLTAPQGMLATDKLYIIDNNKLYKDNAEVSGLTLTSGRKTLCAMGAQVVIFPDKKIYNSADGTYKSLDAEFTITAEPEAAEGEDPAYSVTVIAGTGAALGLPAGQARIQKSGIGAGFKKGDAVKISGFAESALNGTFIIIKAETNALTVGVTLAESITENAAVTITRKAPIMDFICEAENRLWGCRYGLNNDNVFVNEIYASKLGDPTNWQCLEGITSDSYTASVGAPGAFTGCVAYSGYVLFFKDNCIIRLAGNRPSNYQYTTINCRGVQAGSERSLTVLNEALYYKSRDAVCRYTGGLPVKISDALGEGYYKNAVGGYIGDRYYIKMQDAQSNNHIFIYDTGRGLWHKDDGKNITDFAYKDGCLYFIHSYTASNATAYALVCNNGADIDSVTLALYTSPSDESAVKWSAETGNIGLDSAEALYISQLQVRLKAVNLSSVAIQYMVDSDGAWRDAEMIMQHGDIAFNIPLAFPRCDHFRLRFEGVGDANIYSISWMLTKGGEER